MLQHSNVRSNVRRTFVYALVHTYVCMHYIVVKVVVNRFTHANNDH